nr:GAF domain-containing sensor histidine kinase [Nocardioides perillae]
MLDAVVAITSDLEVHRVLQRLVDSACTLVGARYGFLGVMTEEGRFGDFVTHGLSAWEASPIASLPQGLGILGLITEDPRPLRLTDIGGHERAHGFPVGHPAMRSFLGVPVKIRGEVFGNLYLTEKHDGGFTEDDETLVAALAHAAGYVLDNARAYERSERRQVWLEAAARATDLLQPRPGMVDVLPDVVRVARDAAGADLGTFVRPLAEGHELVGDRRDGVDAEALLRELRVEVERAEQQGAPVSTRDSGGQPVLLLPVPARLTRAGLLLLAWPADRRPPDDEEVERVRGFVDHVSLAMDRAQALAERQELMLVADRERIARDLHDVVIQRLFATGLQLQGVRRSAVVPEVRDRLSDAVADLDTTIRDIRSTIFELGHRRATSFREEVRGLVREYVPTLGFSPLVRTAGPVDTAVDGGADAGVGDHLLATLREALSNVARHARAEACVVEVVLEADRLTLSVTDNGVGMPVERQESGLRNARRRAADLGGDLQLLPEEPHGTRLEWSVPLGS